MDDKIRALVNQLLRKFQDASKKVSDQYGSFLPSHLQGSATLPSEEGMELSPNCQGSTSVLSLELQSKAGERNRDGETQTNERSLKLRIKDPRSLLNRRVKQSLPPSKDDVLDENINEILKNLQTNSEPLLSPIPERFLNLELQEKEAADKGSVEKIPIAEQTSLRRKPSDAADVPNFISNCQSPEVLDTFKKARALKHAADRLKADGVELEGTVLHLKSALKLLQVANLLEQMSSENGNSSDTLSSLSLYDDTAKLCGFCAHEFEKSKEMVAASLAHKCTGVAFMKVAFLKQPTVTKDQHEVNASLSTITSEKSPSTASDVNDSKSQASYDDSSLMKEHSSSRGSRNQTIPLQIERALNRLLNFSQDVNNAMEASKRAYLAFDHARAHLDERCHGARSLNSVKRVLDLSFHAIDGVLRLITEVLVYN